ncbi:MAG: S1 RNA-binding domain-containing protein, partial [Bacteroidetes bacterium]|nr:S1 RNA-binding domain-containing protein [Bacteroidota bacterium]
MSEINENPELNETVENSAVGPVAPEVKEETPEVEKTTEDVVEPVVAEIAAAPVVEENVVVEEPVVAEKEAVVKEPKAKTKKAAAEKTAVVEPVEAVATEEEFDWDAFEDKKPTEGTSSKQTMTEMYDNTLSILQEKECVDGIVISMNKREVVVNIGYKSDGIVSVNEFRYNQNLKVGDKVEVYVETLEDKKGQLTLSHKKARAMRSWDRVNAALENDEIITGFIKCRTKGGMIVDVFGIEAFLPGSQIDVKPIRDYDIYVGKTMEFKVVKINHEFRNVVVSHKT